MGEAMIRNKVNTTTVSKDFNETPRTRLTSGRTVINHTNPN